MTERARLAGFAVVSIGLLLVCSLALDWFTIDLSLGGAFGGVDRLAIDLRSMHACNAQGVCGSVPMSSMRTGMYGTFAAITFWGSIGLALLVAFQAGSRWFTGAANSALDRLGYLLGVAVFVNAFLAGYLSKFDPGSHDLELFTLTVSRTWAPLLMMLGAGTAMIAIYLASLEASIDEMPARGSPEAAVPAARVVAREVPVAPAAVEAPVAKPRPVLSFAARTAEITRGGVDAIRNDGKSLLVVWRDVVGVVVRRLPPEYEGSPFVDIVSTKGATLRVLPWTRLSGDPIAGTTEAQRALELARLVVARCPDLQIDPATRSFLENQGEPAQLPDVTTLAAHDARLA